MAIDCRNDWTSREIITAQLVDVLKNFKCKFYSNNVKNHVNLNEISADTVSGNEDSKEGFKENDN